MTEKLYTCKTCGDEKPKTAFYKDARNKTTGIRTHQCKECYTALRPRPTPEVASVPLSSDELRIFNLWLKGSAHDAGA